MHTGTSRNEMNCSRSCASSRTHFSKSSSSSFPSRTCALRWPKSPRKTGCRRRTPAPVAAVVAVVAETGAVNLVPITFMRTTAVTEAAVALKMQVEVQVQVEVEV